VSVAPSTYYDAKTRTASARALRDAVLGPALVQLWKDNYCVYGAHKLWKTARRAGHDVGRDQVARLMRAAGIQGVRRGKQVRTTKPDPGAGRHPDLVKRNFTATAPNQLWVTDLKCRRRHFRSYADPWNMPTLLAMVLCGNAFGVV
jgi:putative transposase